MLIKRCDLYFEEPGANNTFFVLDAVVKRVEETGIRTVVVASHSGRTALEFAKKMVKKTEIFCVSPNPARRRKNKPWPTISDEIRKQLEALGVKIIERTPSIFEDTFTEDSTKQVLTPTQIIRETFYTLGQGFKVAVEVGLMATASGYIEPNTDIISVGGTGEGCDTAIIMKTIYPQTFFSPNPAERLEIREIIAMPRKKIK
ncbi:MAG: pyruvate kinase alpha/beta domain-containing protein [Nitrososphaeria archaeon]